MNALRLAAVSLVVVAACTEHDYEVERVGPRALPVDDAGTSCKLDPDPDGQFPCAIETILKERCQRCHQSPMKNGAPFPLLTWNDMLGDYGGPIYEAMYKAVKVDFMPYCAGGGLGCDKVEGGPVEPLSAEQKAALLEYLTCPVPEYGVSCP